MKKICFPLLVSMFFTFGIAFAGPEVFRTGVKIMPPLQVSHNTEILSADRTILITDKPIHWFDCNGTDRNVILSAEASSTDLVFIIYNDSDGVGEDLVIRDDTPITLTTIGLGQGAGVSCDGTSWKIWFDNSEGGFDSVNKSGTNVTLTVAECSGTLITNYGWSGTEDQNFEFCVAGPGLKTKFLNLVTATKDIYFDPSDNTTQAVLDGTACGDGERVWTDNATAYEVIHFHTFTEDGTNYDWYGSSEQGIWLDKGS